MSMGWVRCERAIYEPAPWLICVPDRLGSYTQRASPDERSLRSCNRLELDGAEQVQRRVRQKSLYLRDSSDMNHMPDQVRQSIVHFLNEWA
jgi:hypothetical protein